MGNMSMVRIFFFLIEIKVTSFYVCRSSDYIRTSLKHEAHHSKRHHTMMHCLIYTVILVIIIHAYEHLYNLLISGKQNIINRSIND